MLYKQESVHMGQDRKGGTENMCLLGKGVICV